MQEQRNWQRMQNRCTCKFFNHVLLFLKLHLIFLQRPLLLVCCFCCCCCCTIVALLAKSSLRQLPLQLEPLLMSPQLPLPQSLSLLLSLPLPQLASGVTVDICAPGVISAGGIRRTSYAPGSSSGQRCFPFVITFCWLQCFVLGFTNWTADATTHKHTHTHNKDIDRTQRQLRTVVTDSGAGSGSGFGSGVVILTGPLF